MGITEVAPSDVADCRMTTEELLALPESDEVKHWLLWGKLIERSVARRSFSHSRTEARVTYTLQRWLDQQPAPKGMIASGEDEFRLSRDPDFTVDVDVAYLSAEQVAATAKNARLVEGPPVLAVEILSSSDRVDDVTEKFYGYMDTGVKLAWRVETVVGSVTVFRPDKEPEGLNVHGFLDGGPHLPGFRVAVAEIFT